MVNHDSTDQELITAALNGQSVWFDVLFARYREQLLSMLRQKCQRADDAEDILQDTFIKSYLNLSRYNAQYTFGQWIYTIARNLFIDYSRKQKDMCMSLDTTAELNTPSDNPTPEESVISKQNGTQLDKILALLPDNYRVVAELRFWKEYSYEEISLALNIPMSTVKTQIRRARKMLCELIDFNENAR